MGQFQGARLRRISAGARSGVKQREHQQRRTVEFGKKIGKALRRTIRRRAPFVHLLNRSQCFFFAGETPRGVGHGKRLTFGQPGQQQSQQTGALESAQRCTGMRLRERAAQRRPQRFLRTQVRAEHGTRGLQAALGLRGGSNAMAGDEFKQPERNAGRVFQLARIAQEDAVVIDAEVGIGQARGARVEFAGERGTTTPGDVEHAKHRDIHRRGLAQIIVHRRPAAAARRESRRRDVCLRAVVENIAIHAALEVQEAAQHGRRRDSAAKHIA